MKSIALAKYIIGVFLVTTAAHSLAQEVTASPSPSPTPVAQKTAASDQASTTAATVQEVDNDESQVAIEFKVAPANLHSGDKLRVKFPDGKQCLITVRTVDGTNVVADSHTCPEKYHLEAGLSVERSRFVSPVVNTAAPQEAKETAKQNSKSDLRSEFFYQPPAGDSAVTMGVKLFTYKFDVKANGTKLGEVEVSGSPIGFIYQYSITDKWSLGVSTDIGNVEDKQSTVLGSSTASQSTGLSDPELTTTGIIDFGSWEIRVGGNIAISPGKHKIADHLHDGDRYSGGITFNPYIATKSKLGNGSGIGLRIDYSAATDRTYVDQSVSPNTESKITGGNEVAVGPYGEFNFGKGFVGGQIVYISVADITSTPSGGGASVSGNGYTAFGIAPFITVDVAPTVTLLGQYIYQNISSFHLGGSLDNPTFGSQTLNLGVRVTF